MSNKRKNISTSIDNLVSATRLANHIRNDPIIDYLDLIDKNGLYVSDNMLLLEKKNIPSQSLSPILNPSLSPSLNPSPNKKRKTSFDYIVEEGYKFEDRIVNKIIKLMEECNLKDKIITIDKFKDINDQYEKTKSIIEENKYEVILGGLLINKKNLTYGYPDIIVLGSWINKFITVPPENIIIDEIYYIIDIKSSTINLINGGKYVSSSNLFEGYKSQIWVYKEALNQIQKCESNFGFILGKKYKYTQDKKEIHINDSFYMLGLIDYFYEKNKGNDIKYKVNNAIKWSKELKKNWKKFKLYPITKKIRPNMKNSFDKNHKKTKKKIAKQNLELTLLWNCGIPQREHALKSGITDYLDSRLTPDKLGFAEKTSKYNILSSMLKTTQSNDLITININNNHNDWQKSLEYEFFVDFETYMPIFDESLIYERKTDELDESQCIYMIGIGQVIANKYIFKCFIINYPGSNSIYKNIKKKYNCKNQDIIQVPNEKILIETFINYVYSFKKINEPRYKFLKKTRLIHWSCAEPSLFSKKLAKYDINQTINILPWFDLMQVFKNPAYPITIKNCFSFSLKEITKSMHAYKMINLEWSDLDDGLLSAFIARDIYKNKNLNESLNNNMQDIVEYNYIDCKALHLILNYIRKYLVDKIDYSNK
jgi:hypothetical protein